MSTVEYVDYIEPDFTWFNSFNDWRDHKDEKELPFLNDFEKRSLESIYNANRVFLLGEPGLGKTRCLEEIEKKAQEKKDLVFLVRSKEVTHSNSVLDCLNKIKSNGQFFSKVAQNDKAWVLFDSLDEIKHSEFETTTKKIIEFLDEHKNIKAIISCRETFFNKYKYILENNSFVSKSFAVAIVQPFNTDRVEKYLKNNGWDKSKIKTMIETFSTNHDTSMIYVPRYLGLLVTYVKDKQNINLKDLTKSMVFEYCIYQKLDIEDKKLSADKKSFVKRILEELALIMEIYQANQITQDELMTFFESVRSNLSVTLLSQVPLETFYNNTLLKCNPDADTVEFDNAEFQEYLASKEITRIMKNNRVVFDLVIDPVLQEILPSWHNTLCFLVEQDATISMPILEWSFETDRVLDETFFKLLTHRPSKELTTKDQKIIFEKVFDYHQKHNKWLKVSKKLAYYFDDSQMKLLEISLNENYCEHLNESSKRYVNLVNLSSMIGGLVEAGRLPEAQVSLWKEKLIEFTKDSGHSYVLQRKALNSLQAFKDESVFEMVCSVWESGDTLSREAFLELMIEVNPNHALALEYFVKGIKSEEQCRVTARYGVCAITETKAIKMLLRCFIKDTDFRVSFYETSSIFGDQDDEIIQNVDTVWDAEIEMLILDFMKTRAVNMFESHKTPKILISLAGLIQKRNKDFVLKLIDIFTSKNNELFDMAVFHDIFVAFAEAEHIPELVNKLTLTSRFRKDDAFSVLQSIKFSKRPNASKIYESGRQFLHEEYQRAEASELKRLEGSGNQRLYQKFLQKLESTLGTDNYMTDLFRFFYDHKADIEKQWTSGNKVRLQSLISTILNGVNPADNEMWIKPQTGGGQQWSLSRDILLFCDCFEAARHLCMDLTVFRQKIIDLIPFVSDDLLETIFNQVKTISSSESQSLVNVYSDKKSDKWKYRPINFIKACSKYRLITAVPVLQDLVRQSELDLYARSEALKVQEKLQSNKQFLENMFNLYVNESDGKLCEMANELLIDNHQDEKSIEWRLQKIKNRIAPLPKQKMSVEFEEVKDNCRWELLSPEFAKPLMRLADLKYQEKFLDLLDFSFTYGDKGEKYRDYIDYLWNIVYTYFDNLKRHGSHKPVLNLEKHIQKINAQDRKWFDYKIQALKRAYMQVLAKPKHFLESVQEYNRLKEQQFLPVTTAYELKEVIRDVIEKDLKQWLEGGGVALFKEDMDEPKIHKLLLPPLESCLIKKGFTSVDIISEPESLNKTKIDIRICYGFIGPVLVELKLSGNGDLSGNLSNKESYKKLDGYIKAHSAHHALMLVLDRKHDALDKFEDHLKKIREGYKSIPQVEVLGLRISNWPSAPAKNKNTSAKKN